MKKRAPDAISFPAEIVILIITGLFALTCIIPFLYVVSVSLTDETTLAIGGYNLIPKIFSTAAYEFVFNSGDQLVRSYFVSIVTTVGGTALSVVMTALYAYALFRKDYPFRKFFTFFAFFTTLFSGGLVPTYMLTKNVLGLTNSFAALIIPGCFGFFNVVLLRTFFTTSVPEALIESAQIDGSGEYRTLFQIILPISLPGLAIVGLFNALGYWNDWFTAMLYVDEASMYPLQYLLMRIERNVQFMIQNATTIGGAQMLELSQNIPQESMRMAMVVLAVLPIACVYPFFQRYFISGLTVGAVKG